jgi:hypothetical protein
MTDPDGPGCFSGRLKVARLSNQGLAMVTGAAQVGDVICKFDLAATTYVLRKTTIPDTELNTTILNFFLDSKRKVRENDIFSGVSGELLNNSDTSKVKHYSFISECFADLPSDWEEQIFWETNRRIWTLLPKFGVDFGPNIFALH